jgi:hypothetical protein
LTGLLSFIGAVLVVIAFGLAWENASDDEANAAQPPAEAAPAEQPPAEQPPAQTP